MTKKMGIRWHLREVMATRGLFMTSQLRPLLAERGVELSREQVYRLVTSQPERINVYTLAALCDILECQVGGSSSRSPRPARPAKRPPEPERTQRGCEPGCGPPEPASAEPGPPTK